MQEKWNMKQIVFEEVDDGEGVLATGTGRGWWRSEVISDRTAEAMIGREGVTFEGLVGCRRNHSSASAIPSEYEE